MSDSPSFNNLERLQKAVDWSIQQLGTPRKKRTDAITQYVGSHYSDGGSDKRVPTNFLELAVTIYTRQLAARAPRAMISTGNPALRPDAYSMELAVNQIPDEIDLGSTLRRAVVEAMFAFGIVKVGIASSGKAMLGQDYGQAFADLVSLDDYFCDMSATSRDGLQYEGNDYWVSLEDARAMYDGKPEDIQPDQHTTIGDAGETRAESTTVGSNADLYAEKVWLRDAWIPSTRQVVTWGVKSKKLIRVIDWEGPQNGPYHILSFSDVPGNLLPLPPIALWRDLHELGNALFRKLGRQADGKKSVVAFQGGNDDDIEAFKKASDGDGIRYNGAKPEVLTNNGIDQAGLAMFLQVCDKFSYFAGGLDSMGGLGPQSDTLGQDKMLQEAASSRVKHMSERTVDFAKSIFKSLAWYEWTDPVKTRKIEKPVPGTNISVPGVWSANTRRGRFEDYDFDIDVYSMQDDSPSTKLQKIGMALERFVFPVMPQLQAQGGQIDLKTLFDMIARFGNVPELTDIVKFQNPEPQPMNMGGDQGMGGGMPGQGGGGQMPGMPSTTTRNYIRTSRPGATRHGRDDVMARLLMGKNVQAAEGAKVG